VQCCVRVHRKFVEALTTNNGENNKVRKVVSLWSWEGLSLCIDEHERYTTTAISWPCAFHLDQFELDSSSLDCRSPISIKPPFSIKVSFLTHKNCFFLRHANSVHHNRTPAPLPGPKHLACPPGRLLRIVGVAPKIKERLKRIRIPGLSTAPCHTWSFCNKMLSPPSFPSMHDGIPH
jgi:hypothetical protein